MQLVRVDPRSVIPEILEELGVRGIGDPSVQKTAVMAEYLRLVLTEAAVQDNVPDRVEPVHTRRLLLCVVQQLDLLWPEFRLVRRQSPLQDDMLDEEAVASIQKVLDYLELLGDVLYLGNGRWIPTPMRAVVLPDDDIQLVVGGLATRHIVDVQVATTGIGRVASSRNGCNYPQQPYLNWVGWLPSDLDQFTRRMLDEAHANGSPSASGFSDYEVFLSNHLRFRLRRAWVPVAQLPGSELEEVHLCRSGSRGNTRYFLGEFDAGKLVREYGISNHEKAKWLQLGLCTLHGLKISAVWSGNWLKIYGALPAALKKHIVALGCPVASHYWVPTRFQGVVNRLLQRYGFKIRGEEGLEQHGH